MLVAPDNPGASSVRGQVGRGGVRDVGVVEAALPPPQPVSHYRLLPDHSSPDVLEEIGAAVLLLLHHLQVGAPHLWHPCEVHHPHAPIVRGDIIQREPERGHREWLQGPVGRVLMPGHLHPHPGRLAQDPSGEDVNVVHPQQLTSHCHDRRQPCHCQDLGRPEVGRTQRSACLNGGAGRQLVHLGQQQVRHFLKLGGREELAAKNEDSLPSITLDLRVSETVVLMVLASLPDGNKADENNKESRQDFFHERLLFAHLSGSDG